MSERIKKINIILILGLSVLAYMSALDFTSSTIQKTGSFAYYTMGFEFRINPVALVGLTTIESIDIFSKGFSDYENGYWRFLLPTLFSFVTGLIVLPFLLVKAQINKHKNNGKRDKYWFVSTILLISVIITSAFTYSISISVFLKSKFYSEVSRFHDEVRSEASLIVMESSEKMILPNELGGGGRSFLNFKDDSNQTRSIELSDVYGESDQSITFRFSDVTDSTAVLIAEAGVQGKENGAPNESYIKLEIEISPLSEQKIRWLRNK